MAPGNSLQFRCNGCGSIQYSDIAIRQHCMGCEMSRERVGKRPFTKIREKKNPALQLKTKSAPQLSEEEKIRRRLQKKNEAAEYRLRKKEEMSNLRALLNESERTVGLLLAENEQYKRRVKQLEAELLVKTSEKDEVLARIIQDLKNSSNNFITNQEGESSSSPTKAHTQLLEIGSARSLEASSSQDECLSGNVGDWDIENITEDSIDLDFFKEFTE